ncbi:hypothetical protein ROG8370_01633 [Roseovarius gaetbuli]|uniref:Uncharacterized protein n=1 Tax=Roseovarius gaetbuli TaxID=1356575 RepID=A0A1X6Z420_9RHOB|nr:hypothetical protein [Roseovarius gaetbuli]SLN39421.1 hypothetical protein ROG8370_01633 [Roseovarius gaetbuli]
MVNFFSSNPFWLFLGVVAGALIQAILHWFERHRQANAALKVLQIEIKYNLEQASSYIDEINRQRELLYSGEISPEKAFFPMVGFDYSALGPINNSGYLHTLLGPESLGSVLRFSGHFNNRTGELLYSALQQEASAGRAVSFLLEEKVRAEKLRSRLVPIAKAKKKWFRLSIEMPKQA